VTIMKIPRASRGHLARRSSGGCGNGRTEDAPRDTLGRVSLTSRQLQVLEFVRSFIGGHGWPPTCREISTAFGWGNRSAAKNHLDVLVRKRWLVRGTGARTIRIQGE